VEKKQSLRISNMSDDSTVLLDIHSVIKQGELEAQGTPPALVIQGSYLNGTIFKLTQNQVIIGKSSENQIVLDFDGISRQHCRVLVKNLDDSHESQSCIVEDLQSKNGTYVNAIKLLNSYELKKGDLIKIGPISLKFIPQNDPEILAYDSLHDSATRDGLTGAFNKAYFNQQLELEFKKVQTTGKPLSLIIFDLDHFKKLNDTFGHDAGDFVLKELAALISTMGVRETDIFARFGGEEFVILLPQTNIKNAFEIAERIRKSVQDHNFLYNGRELPVTASVGVSDYRQGVFTGTDLFKRADQAVYLSKTNGRNQVNFFRPA
jgi:two-component system cell cycle response regulator